MSVCQCPQSGNPHFYVGFLPEIFLPAYMCQCPQSGNPHFYVGFLPEIFLPAYMCQCPQSGNPHFYGNDDESLKLMYVVSMPSVGQSSFLREKCSSNQCIDGGVSMPSVGQSSFLHRSDCRGLNVRTRCQCPQSGNPHFYKIGIHQRGRR